ncbi:uncharacterized protein LOC116774991 [Danaus plexippus]|uniref:uncharacterized protein LOC116774991 n=1 Tax=Danaus plexippus TaxID=13037 RepID=UPI002AB21E4D|nr:uncharacterized protein LOC116774991 [Danaus plexippus]
MSPKFLTKLTVVVILSVVVEIIPIQLQEGEDLKGNNIDGSQLNQCLSVSGRSEVGVCFGKELLNTLSAYDETDTFSLATGVSFVRDEKGPRSIGNFLDKDPMDIRSVMEEASSLISKRSLHWDLGVVYPGLVLRIGPTLANGILEFIIDPKVKERSYHSQGEMTTRRLLTRNLLVPFLLGFKFQLSTLLPLLLGVVLLASKKAFLLAKLAFLAVTLFSGNFGSNSHSNQWNYGGFGGLGSYNPILSSYTSHGHGNWHGHGHGHDHDHDHHYHNYHGSEGYHDNRYPNSEDYYYKSNMKSIQQTTAAPITPEELKERFDRLFVTKKEINDSRDEKKIKSTRDFAWTPINGR